MVTLLEKFNKEQEKNLPELRPGDTIKVHQKIKEGDKERIQIFEGLIIGKKHGSGINATMTKELGNIVEEITSRIKFKEGEYI